MALMYRINNEKLQALGSTFGATPLSKALKDFCLDGYRHDHYPSVRDELTNIYGKAPSAVKTADEFLDRKLLKAIKNLVGKKACDEIAEMVRIRAKGQFSVSFTRRSFHSSDFGYYAAAIIYAIRDWIRLGCYDLSREEMLKTDTSYFAGYEDVLALEINRGNPVYISAAREMILGDNTLSLSRSMIIGIIRSENRELKDLLIKLLLSAGSQEGLRQAILESADAGDLNTFRQIYGCCVENDLFRYSSAARALYTWAGIFPDEVDIKLTKKIAETGWQCLTDAGKRQEYLSSRNPFDMYFALWAKGCEDVAQVDGMLDSLLNAPEVHKRYVGWYFVRHVENAAYRHEQAIRHLNEPEIGVLACATDNLHVSRYTPGFSAYGHNSYEVRTVPDPIYPSSVQERRDIFHRLRAVAERIGDHEWRINGYLFPWSKLVINQKNAEVMRCMFSLAAYDLDPQMIDELFELRGYMDSDLRRDFCLRFLDPDKNPNHRQYLYDGLGDKSVYNKEAAIGKLRHCSVLHEDIDRICALLSSRSANLKKTVTEYLEALMPEDMKYAIARLLTGSENHLQAAFELLLKRRKLIPEFEERLQKLDAGKMSDQTQVLFRQLPGLGTPDADSKTLAAETETGSSRKKYGLFDRETVRETLEKISRVRRRDYLTEAEILKMMPKTRDMLDLLERIRGIFLAHADYEYEVAYADGSHAKVLFGNDNDHFGTVLMIPAEYGTSSELMRDGKARLSMLPFAEEFMAVLKPYLNDPAGYAMLCCAGERRLNHMPLQDWFVPFANKFGTAVRDEFYQKNGRIAFRCFEVILLGLREIDTDIAYNTLSRVYFSLIHILGEGNFTKAATVERPPYERGVPAGSFDTFRDLRQLIGQLELSDEKRTEWFLNEYYLERINNYGFNCSLDLPMYLFAVDRGLIPIDCLYDWLLFSAKPGYNYRRPVAILTNPALSQTKQYLECYPWLSGAVSELVDKMVRYEAGRGQAETEISAITKQIRSFEGKEYFVMLLKSLGEDSFFRGYEWGPDTKSAILSMLLRKCRPAPGDDAKGLGDLLGKTGIKEKRLIEAAMYAPQWSGMIEEITGWTGLKKAVWFFQAHVSELFSADKETEVAIYSPIPPERFNDGAFDAAWFNDVYAVLGEKRFHQLYNCAKYLTNGSNAHRRSQLYSDAVLGKLDARQLEDEITEKRNQEKLRAYGLIPVNDETLLHRYLFIRQYMKDSAAYGAQRRESEKKAGRIALENLAISSGYFDVNRMLWRLEGEMNEELLPLLKGKQVGGYLMYIQIDEAGEPSLAVEKDGKPLKSVPSALAKEPYTEELKTALKELKNQRTRGRQTLEEAMIGRVTFRKAELQNILSSPVIAPMAKDLLWKAGDKIGFLGGHDGCITLTGPDGEEINVADSGELMLAHPHHLFTAGCWAAFMHLAYTRRLVQPFKQIFREYYPLTSEEKEEKTVTRRYAGYQVQPRKTAALLKSRGWTVDYEEGLQKVFYTDNLIVRLYAYADWFSPADIEAPTLEEITISDRKSGMPLPLEKVDPIVFSEIMRDIDLAVSVAYVGGIDAEASHSTVEMRIAIARELVSLLKLTNVEFTQRHARIRGKLADYSVHMGSGIVHAGEKGMLPILPVHSQHRGRIFLPFADEDPKTAEIMSKIILLSEDTKIRDPEILSMLK